MVVILDHGADYMTLYGHNQTLLVRVDQDVKQGEKIALLGRSGFQTKPALYFEIRHQGRAINPQHWLTQTG